MIHHYQVRFIPGMQGCFNIKKKSINVVHHIKRIKKKKHPLIKLIDEQKASDKTQYPFTINSLRKLEIEGKVLNLIKNIYKICTDNIIVCDEKMEFSY